MQSNYLHCQSNFIVPEFIEKELQAPFFCYSGRGFIFPLYKVNQQAPEPKISPIFHVQNCSQSISMNLFMLFFPSHDYRPIELSPLKAEVIYYENVVWPFPFLHLPPRGLFWHLSSSTSPYVLASFPSFEHDDRSKFPIKHVGGHATNKSVLINTSHPYVFRPVNMKRSLSEKKSDTLMFYLAFHRKFNYSRQTS